MKKKTIAVIQAACMSSQKLSFNGSAFARVNALVQNVLKECPDVEIICFQEISYSVLERLNQLIPWGFKFSYFGHGYEDAPNKNRLTALSVIFAKEELVQHDYSSCSLTPLRMVDVAIPFGDESVLLRNHHIPYATEPEAFPSQQERKIQALCDEIAFQKGNDNELCISLGDFNGSIADSEQFYGQDYYSEFVFSPLISQKTWENRQLDNVYISRTLQDNPRFSVSVDVLEGDVFKALSDHVPYILHISAE